MLSASSYHGNTCNTQHAIGIARMRGLKGLIAPSSDPIYLVYIIIICDTITGTTKYLSHMPLD